VEQAARYLDGFEDTCRLLVGQPMLGKAAESVMSGLRRHPYGEHVVFYRIDGDGVLVVRVLHHSMEEGRHL
jgi:toxin ParE1/3/4